MEARPENRRNMMQTEKITLLRSSDQVDVQTGTIECVDEPGYTINSDTRQYHAVRAFSCMVEPMVNDIVLFSTDAAMQCHILAIIERPDRTETRLAFPGDVTLNAGQGRVHLNGQQGISINSQQDINVATEEYTLIANKALFGVRSITAIGSKLVSKISNVQTIADTVETVASNLLQKLKNSFRQIEGVDQLKTQDSIHTVRNLYSMRTTQAAILAKKDIKVDGERIHMG
jgi:hypothetical protein